MININEHIKIFHASMQIFFKFHLMFRQMFRISSIYIRWKIDHYKHLSAKISNSEQMKIVQYFLVSLLFLVGINCYYDTALASPMSYFSTVSYGLPEKITNWNCLSCKRYQAQRTKVFNIPFLKLQGFVGYYAAKHTVFVAFRGTVNIPNVILDLNIKQTDYPACHKCKVHQGFYKSYYSAARTVRKYIQQMLDIYQDAQITVTGHSLGGALAVFCALDLEQIYGNINLYTFGCPRVGNTAFAKYQEKKISQAYRIVNYADAFTQMPLQAFGYHHGGNQVWYSPRGMQIYRICRSEDLNCGKSVGTVSFLDHNPLEYQKLKVQQSRQLR